MLCHVASLFLLTQWIVAVTCVDVVCPAGQTKHWCTLQDCQYSKDGECIPQPVVPVCETIATRTDCEDTLNGHCLTECTGDYNNAESDAFGCASTTTCCTGEKNAVKSFGAYAVFNLGSGAVVACGANSVVNVGQSSKITSGATSQLTGGKDTNITTGAGVSVRAGDNANVVTGADVQITVGVKSVVTSAAGATVNTGDCSVITTMANGAICTGTYSTTTTASDSQVTSKNNAVITSDSNANIVAGAESFITTGLHSTVTKGSQSTLRIITASVISCAALLNNNFTTVCIPDSGSSVYKESEAICCRN